MENMTIDLIRYSLFKVVGPDGKMTEEALAEMRYLKVLSKTL